MYMPDIARHCLATFNARNYCVRNEGSYVLMDRRPRMQALCCTAAWFATGPRSLTDPLMSKQL
jgi:hypothetical protein